MQDDLHDISHLTTGLHMSQWCHAFFTACNEKGSEKLVVAIGNTKLVFYFKAALGVSFMYICSHSLSL